MPHDDTGCHRNIKGMFRAELRNLKASVTSVNNVLMHTLYFISKNYSVTLPFLRTESVKHSAALTLLNGKNLHTLIMQFGYSLLRRTEVTPSNAVLSP